MLKTVQLVNFARVAARRDQSPCLLVDPEILVERCETFQRSLPGAAVFYAYKSFNHPMVVETIDGLVDGYDVASQVEIEALTDLGVSPDRMRYSNPVKPSAAIARAAELGVNHFAYQSENELAKLAAHAPGSTVYLRMNVSHALGALDFSSKFGAEHTLAMSLLLQAGELGLRPTGLTFNVGSQAAEVDAWRKAFGCIAEVMQDARAAGIEITELNIGGGFPVQYQPGDMGAADLFPAISDQLDKIRTEFPDTAFIAEPGRFIGADSGVIVTEVIGTEERGGKPWLYLDTGTFQSFIERFEFDDFLYPVYSVRHLEQRSESFSTSTYALTGPTCDSYDTMTRSIELPAGIEVGDKLLITMAGSYTIAYGSHFNGFSPPEVVFINDSTDAPG